MNAAIMLLMMRQKVDLAKTTAYIEYKDKGGTIIRKPLTVIINTTPSNSTTVTNTEEK